MSLQTKIQKTELIHQGEKYDIIKDSQFLKKIRDGSDYIHEVSFEGNPFVMRILSTEEQREADIVAQERFMKMAEAVRLPVFKYQYTMLETLSRALSIKTATEVLRVSEHELDALPPFKLIGLFRVYEDLCEKYNPKPEEFMDSGIFYALLEDLTKKKVFLNHLSRSELEAFTSTLLKEVITLMDKQLTLSSPDFTTSDPLKV